MIIRDRLDADLPRLVELLVEQRASSQYPISWPLPIPVEEFIVRPAEERAWVATDDDLLGHVAVHRLGDDDVSDAFRDALGHARLGVVSVLFTSLAARGCGVGAALLDTAVEAIRAGGLTPVLDVVPTHARAIELYRHRGWTDVGTYRPPWLGADLVLMTAGAAAT